MGRHDVVQFIGFEIRDGLLNDLRLRSDKVKTSNNSMDFLDSRYLLNVLDRIYYSWMRAPNKDNKAFPFNDEEESLFALKLVND